MTEQGWHGWDEYAPFYDWENARTLGRRDVPFWTRCRAQARGPVLELGCGTGRISLPLARAGIALVGVDRSAPMLARADARRRACAKRSRAGSGGLAWCAATSAPCRSTPARFDLVLAPYGVLQSLLRDRDLPATLDSVVARARAGRDASASTSCPTCLTGRSTRTAFSCAARPPEARISRSSNRSGRIGGAG